MLSAQDNEILCHVGAGTPIGNVMREYWIPACVSSELATPDCPPLRLRLLGEDLIAFRLTSGKVGIVVNACPHRGASLFFGRNEEEGLRCVYHGWKFDATGACVDMPSEPAESNFKSKVRVRAYPVIERNGMIWTYMGPRDVPPPLPDFETNLVGEGVVRYTLTMRECNYMQALEGDIDTSHLCFLHLGANSWQEQQPGSFEYYALKDRAPRYDVIETPYGTSYGAYRPAEADTYYWRTAHFLFPFYTMIPSGTLGKQVLIRAWVPLDDETTMYWGMMVRFEADSPRVLNRDGSKVAPQRPRDNGLLPNTTDWLGRFRLRQNADNDYEIDREKQRRGGNFTGLDNVPLEDQAITESMGPIYRRTGEHLGTSDVMIIRTRRRLINAAKAMRDLGTPPPAVDGPGLYRIRSGGIILPRSADWIETTQPLREPSVAPGEPVSLEA
ncbi:MAG TPA: Rieske 2Fe-2S domain-containing protein [Dehalococcoidia bacterium]|nr:Rieske 2Fe-2S domain-containing protein [Dehalococcoidia bacterium]